MTEEICWIAADWGTSNLRIWGIDATGKVVIQRSSQDGMGGLAPADFEPALLALIGDVLTPNRKTQVLICGMAGAKQGWIEAPYAEVPCVPSGLAPIQAPTKDKQLSVSILPGICQQKPFDVMRGEETQISGFLFYTPDFDGVLCLPGTHSKWVKISGGKVIEFQTAMTGEMFALFSNNSVLRHSLVGADSKSWDDSAFTAAVEVSKSNPHRTIAQLFEIRAASLLSDQTPQQAKAKLSGLLISTEINATKHLWQNKPVVIIGDPELCSHYLSALKQMGCKAEIAKYSDLSLSGLKAAYAMLYGEKE